MASRYDWYRSSDWDRETERRFEEKLKRTWRGHNRAQYLQIQAHYLIEAGGRERCEAAIGLLKRALEEDSESSYNAERCLESLGQAHEALGDVEVAEKFYRQCLHLYAQREKFPHMGGMAAYHLVELILKTTQAEKYEEMDVLLEHLLDEMLPFNSIRFRYAFDRAQLAARLDRLDEAAGFAKIALDLAKVTEPQLPRQPTVGIIRADPEVLLELEALMGAKPSEVDRN